MLRETGHTNIHRSSAARQSKHTEDRLWLSAICPGRLAWHDVQREGMGERDRQKHKQTERQRKIETDRKRKREGGSYRETQK